MIFFPARLFLGFLSVFLVACGNPYPDYESGEATSKTYLDGKLASVIRGGDIYFMPIEGYSPEGITAIEVYIDSVSEENEVWVVRVKDRFGYRFTEVKYGMTSSDFITLKPAQALKKGGSYIIVVRSYGFAQALRYRFVY